MKKKGCDNEPQDNGRCCSQFDGDGDSFVERWILIIAITAVSVLLASLIFGSCDAGAEGIFSKLFKKEAVIEKPPAMVVFSSDPTKTDLLKADAAHHPGICDVYFESKRIVLLSDDVEVVPFPKIPEIKTGMEAGSEPLTRWKIGDGASEIKPMDSSDYKAMERKAGY